MSNTKGRSIQASESSELNEYVEPGIDHHYILIEGVNEAVADETIRLYIMLMLNPNLDDQFKIEKLRRNHRRCLIKFNQTINYSEIATRKPKIPDLAGSSLQFHEMKTPDTIRVTNISNTCGKEMLELYFSNSRVSGGGDIKSVKMYEYDNKALIQFEDFNK